MGLVSPNKKRTCYTVDKCHGGDESQTKNSEQEVSLCESHSTSITDITASIFKLVHFTPKTAYT